MNRGAGPVAAAESAAEGLVVFDVLAGDVAAKKKRRKWHVRERAWDGFVD